MHENINTMHENMKAVPGRKTDVKDAEWIADLLQKMLEGANIKLSGTVSDINGKSARSILEYLLTGKAIDEAKFALF